LRFTGATTDTNDNDLLLTMARGKQQQTKKDGQHRAETKEERRIRLQSEKEAKEVSESLKNVFDTRYPYAGIVRSHLFRLLPY
jgi:hypothetical protein